MLHAFSLGILARDLSVWLWFFGSLHPRSDTGSERARNIPDLKAVVRQSLAWQRDHHSLVKHLCFFTHNQCYYDEERTPPPITAG